MVCIALGYLPHVEPQDPRLLYRFTGLTGPMLTGMLFPPQRQ